MKGYKRHVFMKIGIWATLLFFFVVGMYGYLTQVSKAEPNTDPLKWAPPSLESPTTINLGTGKTSNTLDNSKDYIINLPSSTKLGATVIIGGRNIIIKGGEIAIPTNPGSFDADRRAIYIANNVGVVHIEGVHIKNIHDIDSNEPYLEYDAISINSPSSVVQIQNVRIDNVHGTQSGFHGDILQPWGGVNELRIYNLTGSTSYQGFFVAQESFSTIGGAYFENVDLSYASSFGTDGGYLLYLDKLNNCSGEKGIYPMVINEFYVMPDIPRFGITDETDAVGRSIWPDSTTSFGCTVAKAPNYSSGPDWYWPDLTQITDGNGSNGVVKTGLPAVTGNHFVPSGTPGLGIPGIGYISPGYVNANYSEPVAFGEVTTPIEITGQPIEVQHEIIEVQQSTNRNPQSTDVAQASLTTTFSSDVTSGNTVVVAANVYHNLGGSGNVSSVTDNYGNIYTKATSITGTAAVTNGARYHTSIWYATNVTGGPGFAVTATRGSSTSYYALTTFEYSGIDIITPVDPTTGTATNFETTSTTAASTGAVTTSKADNLLFANFHYIGGGTVAIASEGSGFSTQQHHGSVPSQSVLTGWSGDAGSYSGSLTWNSSVPSLGAIAAFQPAPYPAAFTPTLNVGSLSSNTTPTVTFNTTDLHAIDHYEVKIDDGSFSIQTSPYTLPALSDGSHTVTVRAYNSNNNYTDGFVSVIVDTVDPTASYTDTTITLTDNEGISAGDITATNGTLSCVQNSQTEVVCSVTVIASGDLIVTATDLAGNSLNVTLGNYVIQNNSSNSLSAAGAPICNTATPGSAPFIHTITPKSTSSVLVQFTEASNPVDSYFIEYGETNGVYKYGAGSIGGVGTKSYLVSSLAPNKTYYFRVRAGNGCAVGSWSNVLSGKTLGTESAIQQPIIDSEISPEPTIPDKNKNELETQAPIKTYDVNIIVKDSNENKVKGAKVTIHSSPRTSLTDENGVARFQAVEEGDHKVLVTYNGYEGEQNISLKGDVKTFELDITISPKNIWLAPEMIVVAGVGVTIIIILLIVIFIRRKKS